MAMGTRLMRMVMRTWALEASSISRHCLLDIIWSMDTIRHSFFMISWWNDDNPKIIRPWHAGQMIAA